MKKYGVIFVELIATAGLVQTPLHWKQVPI